MLASLIVLAVLAGDFGLPSAPARNVPTEMPADAPLAQRSIRQDTARMISPDIAKALMAASSRKAFGAALIVPGIVNALAGLGLAYVGSNTPKTGEGLVTAGIVTGAAGVVLVIAGGIIFNSAEWPLAAVVNDPTAWRNQ
jgi:hypothetical protein